jgi:predicted RecB family nuclease
MQKQVGGRLVYSPSDLVLYAASPFASWMDRRALEYPDQARPEPPSEEDQLLFDQGLAHEKAYLEALGKVGRELCQIPDAGARREALTRSAMEEGREIICQAALSGSEFVGIADFLEKTPGKSKLGDYHYIPIDTKMGANPKPHFLIQLSVYAEMVEEVQGRLPGILGLILRGMERRDFRTEDVLFYARAVKMSFLKFMGAFDASHPPVPESGADHRGWSGLAELKLKELDHPSAVAGITRSQIKKLGAAGIDTFTKLSATKLLRVPRLSDATFVRLRDQAALQKASEGKERPEVRIIPPNPEDPRKGLALLPPPSPKDVYFDMEGYPHVEGGLEYLFGAVHLVEGKPEFRDWWAHDRVGEKRAFEGFIDWVFERWKRDPAMHIYHYAAYEVSAARRLMGRHATREEEVDDLLRAEVFVDLYAVVRTGIRLGTPS